jgi:hypothetical protein
MLFIILNLLATLYVFYLIMNLNYINALLTNILLKDIKKIILCTK